VPPSVIVRVGELRSNRPVELLHWPRAGGHIEAESTQAETERVSISVNDVDQPFPSKNPRVQIHACILELSQTVCHWHVSCKER